MSVTKPLIFTNVGIGDANGSNITYYPLHVSESATVTVTPTFDTIDDGQQLSSFYDLEVSVISFNANIFSDTRVYTNTTATPKLATIFLSGATGAQNLNIGSTYVSANRVYDGNRTGIQLSAKKRAVSDDLLAFPS